VLDVVRFTPWEQVAQHGIVKHLLVEQFLETVQGLVSAGMFVERFHLATLRLRVLLRLVENRSFKVIR
jgi:hypothetical protein